jgi:hypothetical protein
VGEAGEPGEGGNTPEERLYLLESQLEALARSVQELTLLVLGANSYVLLEHEGADPGRVVKEAKEVAADLGDLLHTLRERWPPPE